MTVDERIREVLTDLGDTVRPGPDPYGRLMNRRRIQKARPKGRAQPFVTTGRVKVAAEGIQRHIFLHQRMWTVDTGRNAPLLSSGADFFHGQGDGRW